MKIRDKTNNPILPSGEIARITADIAKDIQIRDEADERISKNKALLAAHDKAVAGRIHAVPKQRRIVVRRKAPEKLNLRHRAEEPDITIKTPNKQTIHIFSKRSAKLPKGGGSVGIVLDVLRDHPDGLTPPEVKKIAVTHPEASKSLRQHGQYLYSILETLKTRGEAEKGDDGRWRPTNAAHAAGAATTH